MNKINDIINKNLDSTDCAEIIAELGNISHEPPKGYLPDWIRDAMKREGVVRSADGSFHKIEK